MLFRESFITKPLAYLLGLVILNFSVLLTEVTALELKLKNKVLYDELVNLIPDSGLEEEKDTSGESSNESTTEVNPYLHVITKIALINDHDRTSSEHFFLEANWSNRNLEVFSPPPEG